MDSRDALLLALVYERWVARVEKNTQRVFTGLASTHQCWLSSERRNVVRVHVTMPLYGCVECGRLHYCEGNWRTCYQERNNDDQYVCCFSGRWLGVGAVLGFSYDEEQRLKSDLGRRGYEKLKKAEAGDIVGSDRAHHHEQGTPVSLEGEMVDYHYRSGDLKRASVVHDLPPQVDIYRTNFWSARLACVGEAVAAHAERCGRSVVASSSHAEPLAAATLAAPAPAPVVVQASMPAAGRRLAVPTERDLRSTEAAVERDTRAIVLALGWEESEEQRVVRADAYWNMARRVLHLCFHFATSGESTSLLALKRLAPVLLLELLQTPLMLDDHAGHPVLIWEADAWLVRHRLTTRRMQYMFSNAKHGGSPSSGNTREALKHLVTTINKCALMYKRSELTRWTSDVRTRLRSLCLSPHVVRRALVS